MAFWMLPSSRSMGFLCTRICTGSALWRSMRALRALRELFSFKFFPLP